MYSACREPPFESLRVFRQGRTINLKRLSKAKLPFEILRFACFKIDKAQRHQYWTFDVGRSMFDVKSVYCSVQAEFHIRWQAPGSWSRVIGQKQEARSQRPKSWHPKPETWNRLNGLRIY